VTTAGYIPATGIGLGGGGGGGVSDGRVLISATDTTLDHVEDKLTAGSGITLTVLNPGGNETLEISASGSGLPAAAAVGQLLFSVDGTVFTAQTPLTSPDGWLVDSAGLLLVAGG